jgi:S-adenosylmethionine hydrolase
MTDMRSRPVITLTTDFGTQDHYVGTMKCVIAGICPDAAVIDITHQIRPGDLYSAAYSVSQSPPFSPPGTIHVVVVDPGVGTSRRAIAARVHGQTFIAPDNGVLSLVFQKDQEAEIRTLANPLLELPSRSATFHGRDVFAPAAAKLAAHAVAWTAVGPKIEDCIRLPGLGPLSHGGGKWSGMVLSIDHFGNVITNLPVQLADLSSKSFKMQANGTATVQNFFRTFQESGSDTLFVYAGSSGYYEIGINGASAANALRIKTGDPIILTLNARTS